LRWWWWQLWVLVARSVVSLVKVVVAVGREMAAEVVVELAVVVVVVVAVVVEVEVAVAGGVLLSPQNVHHHIDYFIR
jgi:hypothetical protein